MLTEAIENLLNRNLSTSAGARELCATLRGRRLAVCIDGTPWQAAIESLGSSLKLTRSIDGSADATITGTPLSLAALAGDDAEAVIRRGSVRIDGDTEVAQQYQRLLQLLRPDIEEELARLIGDSPAHQILRVVSGALGYGRSSAQTLTRAAGEYLAHERRVLVPRAEAEAFFHDVELTRDAVARLAAKLQHLEAGFSATPNSEAASPRPGSAS